MDSFLYIQPDRRNQLPARTGVYAFTDAEGGYLYIGKAADIRSRVKDHFQQPGFKTRFWIDKVAQIGYEETQSEIGALLREAELINYYQPQFNVMWRDDKNYFYVAITNEDYPRVYITHQPPRNIDISTYRNIDISKYRNVSYIGPFVDGEALKTVLKYLRRIFPYYTRSTGSGQASTKHPTTKCQWCHIGMCPGPSPDKQQYHANIEQLAAVLRGEKEMAKQTMQSRMEDAARAERFEEASAWRDKLSALERIMEHGRIFRAEAAEARRDWPAIRTELCHILNLSLENHLSRVEAYDVSNIRGAQPTASQATFIDGFPEKEHYRRYKIRTKEKPDDCAMLEETLQRRFHHPEWGYPDLILVDGGVGQLNAGRRAIRETWDKQDSGSPLVVALAKREEELHIPHRSTPLPLSQLSDETAYFLQHIRDEAHRFAVAYHRKRRKEAVEKSI